TAVSECLPSGNVDAVNTAVLVLSATVAKGVPRSKKTTEPVWVSYADRKGVTSAESTLGSRNDTAGAKVYSTVARLSGMTNLLTLPKRPSKPTVRLYEAVIVCVPAAKDKMSKFAWPKSSRTCPAARIVLPA